MAETAPATEKPEGDSPNQLDLFAQHATEAVEAQKKTDARMQELLAELREQRRKPAAEPAEKPTPERVYTAPELQKLIDDGKITLAEAADYLAEVKSQKALEQAKKEMREQIVASQGATLVSQKIDGYLAAIPELADKTSDAFKDAQAAFSELVQEGEDAKDLRTQLRALQIVFGRDPKSKRAERSEPRETTAERQRSVEATGSSSGRNGKERSAAPRASGLPGWLKPEHAALYEQRIQKGVYKGAKDPTLVKELELMKKRYDKARAA